MSQNRSHAVMAARHEPSDSLDFFPTPPWATRALIEHVLIPGGRTRAEIAASVVWEPACGADHMVRPLSEYFRETIGTDVHDYGHAAVHDFLMPYLPKIVEARPGPHWVITNPPFRLATEFVLRGIEVADHGVAMLVRTAFLEGVTRHRDLFSARPPIVVAQFSERVPMVKGRLDPAASTATSYAWIVWSGRQYPRLVGHTRMIWIPPCRRALERPGDYDEVS